MKPFKEDDEYCSFVNKDLKNEFYDYMIYGRPNEKKLSFGENPLIIYQNIYEWFNSEVRKLQSLCVIPDEEKAEKLTLCGNLIAEMNEISASIKNLPIFMFPDKKDKLKRQAKKVKRTDGKTFTCDVCNEEFESGQGLGGHMSRKHPNSSTKFIKKKETRDNRKDQRNVLYDAKKKLLEKYSLDYDELKKTMEGRHRIKEAVNSHKTEYKTILKLMKSDAVSVRK